MRTLFKLLFTTAVLTILWCPATADPLSDEAMAITSRFESILEDSSVKDALQRGDKYALSDVKDLKNRARRLKERDLSETSEANKATINWLSAAADCVYMWAQLLYEHEFYKTSRVELLATMKEIKGYLQKDNGQAAASSVSSYQSEGIGGVAPVKLGWYELNDTTTEFIRVTKEGSSEIQDIRCSQRVREASKLNSIARGTRLCIGTVGSPISVFGLFPYLVDETNPYTERGLSILPPSGWKKEPRYAEFSSPASREARILVKLIEKNNDVKKKAFDQVSRTEPITVDGVPLLLEIGTKPGGPLPSRALIIYEHDTLKYVFFIACEPADFDVLLDYFKFFVQSQKLQSGKAENP